MTRLEKTSIKKTCHKCKKEKGLNEFVMDAQQKDGHISLCKECNRLKYYEQSNPSRRNHKTIVVEGKKKCRVCGHIKLLEEFVKAKRHPGGRQNKCKDCRNLERRNSKPKHSGVICEEKTCKGCGKRKTSEEFTKESRSPDGLASQCKDCFNSKRRLSNAVKRSLRPPKIIDGKKKCRVCGAAKPLEEFSKSKNSTGGCGRICKLCKNAKQRLEEAEFKKKVVLFKGGKCEICGLETDHYEIYDFHHENPGEKNHIISKLVHKDWTTIVIPELLKCSLLCTNCHASVTSSLARLKPHRTRSAKYCAAQKDVYSEKCVKYKGGRCKICGLTTDDHAKYDFHHIDPKTKQYEVGRLTFKDWDTVVRPELDKCEILCRNCHRSVHYGRYGISSEGTWHHANQRR